MKHFIIILNFILFSSFIAKANVPSPETPPRVENAERAIWKISNDFTSGSGFFIGPNQFVTNLHVINPLLHKPSVENTLREDEFQEERTRGYTVKKEVMDGIASLSQENNSSVLKVKEVLAVSVLYDLALLETEESVTDYLSLREGPLKPNENLFVIGYPKRVLTTISKTGASVYEDNQRYDFPVNHSSLKGVSGSPVLSEQGLVVGVAFLGNRNILSFIKINHLNELITEDIGMKCFGFNSVTACIEEEI